MADEIHDAITQIEERRKALEREIERLKTAAEVLRALSDSPSPSTAQAEKPEGITAAVRQALKALDEADTATVIRYIRRQWMPDANKNSVRSILAVGRRKGEFTKQGKRYALREPASESAGAKGGQV
jgi:cell division septum initiation protein DivIVA